MNFNFETADWILENLKKGNLQVIWQIFCPEIKIRVAHYKGNDDLMKPSILEYLGGIYENFSDFLVAINSRPQFQTY